MGTPSEPGQEETPSPGPSRVQILRGSRAPPVQILRGSLLMNLPLRGSIKPRTNENLSGLPPRKTPVLGFFKRTLRGAPKIRTAPRSCLRPGSRIFAPRTSSDVGRALELFRQAAKCGLVPDSEHSRLLWLAAIERARTVPARNPAGVFLFIVKNRLWKYLSDGHFEAANARLKAFLHPPMPKVLPVLTPRLAAPEPPGPMLSKDAELLRLLREKLRGQGGSIFAALRSHAGWDRDRYAAALAELEAAGAPVAAGI